MFNYLDTCTEKEKENIKTELTDFYINAYNLENSTFLAARSATGKKQFTKEQLAYNYRLGILVGVQTVFSKLGIEFPTIPF